MNLPSMFANPVSADFLDSFRLSASFVTRLSPVSVIPLSSRNFQGLTHISVLNFRICPAFILFMFVADISAIFSSDLPIEVHTHFTEGRDGFLVSTFVIRGATYF